MKCHRMGPWALLALLACGAAVSEPAGGEPRSELFATDFESDLTRWEISNPEAITIVDSGSPEHARVGRPAVAATPFRSRG